MNALLSVALPAQLQRRGEIVGLICGALCFPFAFFGESLGKMLPAGPAGVILPIVFFSALAGIIASVVGQPDEAEIVAGCAPRVGIRAGLVATLVGGALTVFAATLHAFGLGQPAEVRVPLALFTLLLPSARPFQILVIALLGIPPSVFFGMAGALITAMLRTPSIQYPAGGDEAAPMPVRSRRTLFITVIAFSAIGYLSPFALTLRPIPRRIVAVPVVTLPQAPAPTPAPTPKWHYEKPPGFDNAEADRIIISEQRSLDDVEGNLPVAMSPDGRFFAYCRRASALDLEICDLDTLDIVASIENIRTPSALAWSPDGKMLLFPVEAEARQLQVFDVANSRLMLLPQPKDARVPNGRPEWWDATEVLFVSSDGPQALNLDTLRVHPAKDSAKWNTLPKERQDELVRGVAPSHLMANARWQIRVQAALRRYTVPVNTSANWSLTQSWQLAFFHPEKAYRSVQPTAEVRIGDALVAASDGTKLVRIRDRQATVFYFGVRSDALNTHFKATMPSAPEASLSNALATKSICAFVCRPLVNPLNGKTVGPDRDHIKALARFANWKDKEAELWIEEDNLPVQPGDVVADIHTWENNRPIPAGELGKSEWFAVIDHLDSNTPLPVRLDAPLLDREPTLLVNGEYGADRVENLVIVSQHKPADSSQPAEPSPSVESKNNAPFSLTPDVAKAIAAFLVAHHSKSSHDDVNGLVEDYGEHVDHFDHGVVDREFIRKDEQEYHSPGTKVTETIVTPTHFAPLGGTIVSATYTIAFLRIRPDGHWSRGLSDIDLQIDVTSSGPRIIRQRAQNRNVQKGP
jgi:hypothetical protein